MNKIPKIIHYCWLSNDEKPDKIKKCMASWSEVMPDYEIRHWGMDSFDFDSIPFLKDAISKRKWAYVADFIRLYAVYTEGGIYLDTDVLVLKKFDDFLDNEMFIGTESTDGVTAPEAAIFGGRKGQPVLIEIMSYYKNLTEKITDVVMKRICEFDENARKIHNDRGELQLAIAPFVIGHYLVAYGYKDINKLQKLKQGIVIYPKPMFVDNINDISNETYAVHFCAHSWVATLHYLPEGRGPIFKLCRRYNLHKTYRFICKLVDFVKK